MLRQIRSDWPADPSKALCSCIAVDEIGSIVQKFQVLSGFLSCTGALQAAAAGMWPVASNKLDQHAGNIIEHDMNLDARCIHPCAAFCKLVPDLTFMAGMLEVSEAQHQDQNPCARLAAGRGAQTGQAVA